MNSLNQGRRDVVYKIMRREEWDSSCIHGLFEGSCDDKRDGFIHLSAGAQVGETARKYFSGQEGLVLIAIRTTDLGKMLKWEPSRGGAHFPHLYAPLATTPVVWVRDMELAADGAPIVPGDIL